MIYLELTQEAVVVPVVVVVPAVVVQATKHLVIKKGNIIIVGKRIKAVLIIKRHINGKT